MEKTKAAELFRVTRTGNIQMSMAITDLSRIAIGWGVLMVIQSTALACYFVFQGHVWLFLTFLAILVASIALIGWGYFALPYSVDELLEDPEEIAEAKRRDSWKLPD